MKRLICTTAAAALVALPLAAPVMAQQTATDTQQQVQTQNSQMAQAGRMEIEASELIGKRLYIQRDGETAGMAQPEGTTTQMGDETAQTDRLMPEGEQSDSAMMEQGVMDPRERWRTAGQINDVLLSEQGEVRALLIDAGGLLGGGQGDRRVDVQDVRFVPHAEDQNEFFVVYSGDRQMLEGTERHDEAQMQQGEMRGTQMWGDEMRGTQAEVAFTSITTDDLVGTSVYGPGDEWVGDVSELALTQDGEIEAVVVDVGGFLGIGERSVALSMDQIQLRRGEGGWFGDDLRAYVNATEEQLEELPEWEDG
jgi:hypothetical protein